MLFLIFYHPLCDILSRIDSREDVTSLMLAKGYQSHLVALQLWLEVELRSHPKLLPDSHGPRSVLAPLSQLLSPFIAANPYDLRPRWVAKRLVERDRKNKVF